MDQEAITTSKAFLDAVHYEQFIVANYLRHFTPLLLNSTSPKYNEHVLDVACGTGLVARSVVPRVGPNGKVFGVDINPAMLEVACRQFSDDCDAIEWHEGMAENLPFPNWSFDVVLCQQGIQFFVDRQRAAEEMRRVLKPGGRVGVESFQSIEQNPFQYTIYEIISEVFQAPFEAVARPFSFGEPSQLAELLLEAGFRRVRVDTVTKEIQFPEADQFIEKTIKGAAAVIPAYGKLDGPNLKERIEEANWRAGGIIASYSENGVLTFPMVISIATAVR